MGLLQGEDAQRSLQLGYKVLLQGLAGGARHNEKEGTVEKFMGERGRWSVKLSTGEPRCSVSRRHMTLLHNSLRPQTPRVRRQGLRGEVGRSLPCCFCFVGTCVRP